MRTCILALLFAVPALAEWKPAPVPISTRWAKEVRPDKVLPEYPRPQLVRPEWANLNGLWDYAITAKDAKRPEKWDGRILVPFCAESSLSGVGARVSPDQALWYRRDLGVPGAWRDRRLLLHFGAVDWETTVWINGKEVGTHRGGFDPFSFDVTEALQDGKGELVVRVWDPTDAGSQPVGKQIRNPHGIWYTPVTGIWQTVWLEPVNRGGNDKSVRAVTDLEKDEVEIKVEMGVAFGNQSTTVEIIDGDKMIAKGKPGEKIKVANAKRWSPDTPHLYGLKVSTVGMDANAGRDEVGSYFAFRSIGVGKDEKGFNRLLLNGKPLFQYGPLDQGWWPDGLYTAPTDAALKFDLQVLKDVGMNMLRKHIKVEPARLYHYCDQMGLLVWQDMPSAINRNKKHFVAPSAKDDAVFTAEEKAVFRHELKAMIDHLAFFPCIVVWVPFNEGWGQHDTNDVLKWVTEYDPTRLVDGPSGWADRGYGHMKDLHQYPGPGMFPPMDTRVSVLGEFGGLGLPLKGHLWKDSDNWGYRTYKSTEELRANYGRLVTALRPLIGRGLAAAVYTQTTDVEVEVNGLMSYDREVLKFDLKETAKWHKALYGPAPAERTLVETAEKAPQKWKYTLQKPAAGWEQVRFDTAAWKEGEAGFGTPMTPGSVVRTEWKTLDIWARREFNLKDVPTGTVFLRIHHDENAEVYINGVLAARVDGYVTDYTLVPLTAEGQKALKAGPNSVAVHCKQTGGGQYIDLGLVELVEGK